jgi:hypothetical protein
VAGATVVVAQAADASVRKLKQGLLVNWTRINEPSGATKLAQVKSQKAAVATMSAESIAVGSCASRQLSGKLLEFDGDGCICPS